MTEIPEILEHLSCTDRQVLLRKLIQDQAVASHVANVIETYWLLTMPNEPPDVEIIAEKICSELVSLEIEKIWTIVDMEHDDIEPHQLVEEMIDKALEPFVADLELFLSRRLFKQATCLCRGLMRGLYRYAYEHSIEMFEDSGLQIPVDCAHSILYHWRDADPPFMEMCNMLRFVRQELPYWGIFLLSHFTFS